MSNDASCMKLLGLPEAGLLSDSIEWAKAFATTGVKQLVGRDSELAALKAALSDTVPGFVTISGPAGVGKSALARALTLDGRELVIVNALPASDEPSLIVCVARALGAPPSAGDLAGAIEFASEPAKLLLVLDSFEHLVEIAAEAINRLIKTCPDLKLVITSRTPLGSPLEHTFSVDPLHAGRPDTPGVELFKRHMSEHHGVYREQIAIEEVTEVLGGNPLAVELVARNNSLFSAERLSEPASGAPGTVLENVIASVYESCSDAERACWELLAACPSGLTVETYRRLAPGDRSPLRLCAAGIVTQGVSPAPSMALLPALQEYIQRTGSSASRATTASRIDAYFLALLDAFWDEYRSPRQAEALRQLELELPNILLVLDRVPAAERMRAIVRSFDFWEATYQIETAYRRLDGHERVAFEFGAADQLRLRVALAYSRKFLGIHDDPVGREALQEHDELTAQSAAFLVLHLLNRETVEELGAREGLDDSAFTKCMIRLASGTIARERSNEAAISKFEDAASIAEFGNLPVQAYLGYREAGYLQFRMGLYNQALEHTRRAYQLECGVSDHVRFAAGLYGRVLTEHLNFDAAHARLEESYRSATVGGFVLLRRYCLLWLARLDLLCGAWDQSREHALKALVLAREATDAGTVVNALHAACEASISAGRLEEARRFMDEARCVKMPSGFLTPHEWTDVCIAKIACMSGEFEEFASACWRLMTIAIKQNNRAVLLRATEAARPDSEVAVQLRRHLCGEHVDLLFLSAGMVEALHGFGASDADVQKCLQLIGAS